MGPVDKRKVWAYIRFTLPVLREVFALVVETLKGPMAPSVGELSWNVCIPCQGLFARRRQLLLTEGPHLYYVDPVNRVLKGEIPWSLELRPEAKNFKTFFVHTVIIDLFLTLNKYFPSSLFLLARCLVSLYMCGFVLVFSLTGHTIWWTQVEMQTDGARRSRKCGERSIKGTKTLAYRSTISPAPTTFFIFIFLVFFFF